MTQPATTRSRQSNQARKDSADVLLEGICEDLLAPQVPWSAEELRILGEFACTWAKEYGWPEQKPHDQTWQKILTALPRP